MSTKTPRTDESTLEAYCRFDQGGIYDAETRGQRDGRFVDADFARQLETELQEAKDQIAFLDRQVHIHDEMLAGLEETQTICEAQQEALNHLSTLTIPISDVKLLLEALAYYTHQPYSAAARAVDAFFTKHPDLKL